MSSVAEQARENLDVAAIRRDFPILERRIGEQPLVYLDTAASSQRPRQVIDAVRELYEHHYANIHRGVHTLSQEATEAYENARDRMAGFVNARAREEVVFTRGTTESINLVAQSFLRPLLKAGDQVLVTRMEHHSNYVPWKMVCDQTGAELLVVGLTPEGELDQDDFHAKLSSRVKLFAVGHVSNALGTINPLQDMIAAAHQHDIPVLVDGAQAAPHLAIDVQALDCDFYCLSGHKMYGPTGVGILWGRRELLDAMPPWQGGGEMIQYVSLDEIIWNQLPGKFEAGTPNIAGAVGLGAAVQYLQGIGLGRIAAHEAQLLDYASERLSAIEGLRIIGTARHKASVISFTVEGVHPHDLGTIIDHAGIAIRTGHHCAMPVIQYFNVPATARVSLGLYNDRDDIDRLIPAVEQARSMLA